MCALGILLASRWMWVKPQLQHERSQNEVQFSFHPQVTESRVVKAPPPSALAKIPKEVVPAIKKSEETQKETNSKVITASFVKRDPASTVIEIVNPVEIKYEIQPGDRLDIISNKFYGTHQRWKELLKANPGLDPAKIKPGQIILIPGTKTDLPKQETVYLSTHSQNRRAYKVRENDLLSKIAEKELGSIKFVSKILELNPGLKPDLLRPGQTIYLPVSTTR